MTNEGTEQSVRDAITNVIREHLELGQTWCDEDGMVNGEWTLADAILTTLSPPDSRGEAVPEGYVLVPIEPTEAMLDKGQHANSEWLNDNAPIGEHMYRAPAKAVWSTMIAAAKP